MAAVAAEPGASAAATTTAGEGAEPEWETAQPLAAEPELKAEAAAERVPGMDLACLCEDGDAAQECSVAPPREAQCSAVPEAGGRAHCHREEDDEHGSAGEPGASRSVTAPTNPGCEAEAHHQGELDGGAAERSAPLSPAGAEPEAADEVSGGSPGRTGLVSSCSPELETAAVPLETEELAAPALLLLCATESRGPEGDRTTGSAAGSDAPFTDAPGDAHRGEDAALGRAPAHTATGRDSPRGDARTDPAAVECEAAGLKLAAGSGEERGLRTEPIAGLIPGSEVRVSLDHIIDDALVVSFRLGEKVFSGVLMDLSKRFGPYGIPVTVFPKREYRDKPEPMQLKTDLLPSDAEKGGDGSSADPLHTEPSQVSTVPTPSPVLDSVPDQWTLKPPPLFQEGAPYPPPLFIRDTYSQSIPQPPPRKIKRPKRKLYREEPTSIMSAIKLRPRQVLCDKCKGAVVGDKREVRKAPAGDCRGDEAKRRRGEGAPAVGKRPRTDPRAEERGRASEGSRVRVSTSTGQAKANNVVKVVTSSTSSHASNSRVQLNTKKVLQSKNVDHSKAREVLKMAKEAHRRQRDKVGSGARARTPMTRASSLQDQKVHFTRRLHQISGGAGGGNTAPLPPRIRIKPQRYRNEENNSSPYKPPGFEKVPGSRTAPKPAAPRCTSTRSSSSSSCSGGVATAAAAESHGLTEELEPELSPQVSPHSHSHSHPELEPSPIPKPFKDDGEPEPETEAEETGGREERREKRGPKAGNLTVYMSLHPGQPDSSSVSVCSVDSADDLKSSNSECSSTETLDFPPPGALHSPPVPSTSSIGIASSTTSSFSSSSVPKEEKKSSKPLKTAVFSKNVSKCVTADGRTICVGDIVWAKIYGFPWWPARILVITVSRKDNGLLVRQEARISWFGSPTTSFLALSQVTPFLENFQSRFDKKRKGLYRKAIAEAAKAAKQLTPERSDTERLLISPLDTTLAWTERQSDGGPIHGGYKICENFYLKRTIYNEILAT